MPSKKIPSLLQAWIGPHLPLQHVFPAAGIRENLFETARRWIVRPCKRHIAYAYSGVLSTMGCETIAITGSAGKTTAKELIAAVLSQKYPTTWSAGNIDPVYNIPNTILRTGIGTKKLVLEFGIEYPGEMEYYLWLARPTIGVVTNIYFAHTEPLGGIEGVAREKGKLVEQLPPHGHAVLNYDDLRVRQLAQRTHAHITWYGTGSKASIQATDIRITSDLRTQFTVCIDSEKRQVELQLLGQHYVHLALAAVAVGRIYGVELDAILRGLESVQAQPHRMKPLKLADETIIIDDTYNANPAATIEALRVLASIAQDRRTLLVFGEMKELGTHQAEGHRQVGEFAATSGVTYIFALGDATRNTISAAVAQGMKSKHVVLANTMDELLVRLDEVRKPGDVILVKGSRVMRMERVIEYLRSCGE